MNRSQVMADLELSERRHWTATDCFSRHEESERVDARSVDQMGTAERDTSSHGDHSAEAGR